jgi:FixJ family two-component response regulator
MTERQTMVFVIDDDTATRETLSSLIRLPDLVRLAGKIGCPARSNPEN